MKKIVYLVVCAFALISFSNCTMCSKKEVVDNTPAPSEFAKKYSDNIKNCEYDMFVEAIVLEPEIVTPATPKKPAVIKHHTPAPEVKTEIVSVLNDEIAPAIQNLGGLTDVAVLSETISEDGLSAEVVMDNTFANGEKRELAYDLVKDVEAQVWKIKMGENREVWKFKTADGHKEVIKLKHGENRDIIKHIEDGEKEFVKEIEKDGKVVEKVLEEGKKEVTKVAK